MIQSNNNRCKICSHISKMINAARFDCEQYLLEFLINLQNKLDDPRIVDQQFAESIFVIENGVDIMSCNGLTLMHLNILGGRNVSTSNEIDQENLYLPKYEETTAIRIAQILVKYGGSANGNKAYEMRPLHLAIRRQWLKLAWVLLEAGADPNIPEKNIYDSYPMDIAVINDDIQAVQLLHHYGASLHGRKSMFHLRPLGEAFMRGYFDIFKILLDLGAPTILDLDRNTFRSFGTELFQSSTRGRRRFIQLLYEHGGNIESEFRLHPMRIEPDGFIRHHPEIQFSWEPVCIADLDSRIFVKWLCETRSLKEYCRLKIRQYCFQSYGDGYQRLLSLKSYYLFNQQLINYVLFNRSPWNVRDLYSI